MRGLRFRSRLVTATGALACASVAFALPAAAGGNSARDLLTKVQDFVDDAESVQYEGDIETEISDVVPGSGLVDRGTLEESAVFPNRGRSLIEFPSYVTETLYIKKDVYVRDAESMTRLEETKFAKLDPERPGSAAGTSGEFFLFERPQDFGDVLQSAQRPEIMRAGEGDAILEVTFPASELFTAGFEDFDEAAGEFVVTSDGRPKQLTLTASGPDSRMEVVYRFVRWNSRVKIETPKRADLDPTPFIDEEAVAEYQDTPLYQPSEIPNGWVIDLADVLPPEQIGGPCDEVEVDYVDPEDEAAGYLYMYMYPASCSFGELPGSEEFVAGPYRGFTYEDEFGVYYELDVNGTWLEVDTDLDRDALAALLANLVPLDLANPPPATASVTPAV